MMKSFGLNSLSRRQFLRGAASAAALATAGPSLAQSSGIDSILSSPGRGSWDDQFDAKSSRAAVEVVSNIPVMSVETQSYVQQAMFRYRSIVDQGGWPYVPANEKLELGVVDPTVGILRKRLMVSGDLAPDVGLSDAFDSYVQGAVRKFQARHGLPADGVIGNHTFSAMNVSARVRLGQLQRNMDRMAEMPEDLGQRFVMVNIPAASIEAVESNNVALRHTAIVGKIDRQTPTLNSRIHEIILNPYWTAPRSIIEKDIVPLMRKDPTYLTRNSIRLFDYRGNEVPPQTIDWHAAEAPDLMFRQDPGKINAMSSTKINFYNPHAVYMHDTPQQSLFGKLLRFESSGCVRVQNIRDLTTWLLRDEPGWSRQHIEAVIASGINTPIPIENAVPVYFIYATAWSTADGIVQFRDDIYRLDGAEELAFNEF